MNIISFPGLGLSFTINKIAFEIFGREIYWYGIIIATALLLATYFCIWEGKRVCLPNDLMTDIVLYATPISIIFARAYFVFWNFKDYAQEPLKMFAIWEGGIAIYGAIIGGVLTGYIYCKIKKISFPIVADVAALGLMIGQIIGRWGNFVNVEAYGGETTLPWRMQILNQDVGRIMSVHPTFFYESIWNLVGLIALFLYRKHKKFSGEVFLLYTVWYGIGRTWIEQLRVDSLPYNGDYKISQIVAIITAIAGIILIIYNRSKTNQKNYYITQDFKGIPICSKIRTNVFIDEQGFDEEFDEIDNYAYHIIVKKNKIPVATGRLFKKDEHSNIFKIGRIAVLKDYRGNDYGKNVVQELEKFAVTLGADSFELSAQIHALKFYEKLGYTVVGEPYFEEHVEHIYMKREV